MFAKLIGIASQLKFLWSQFAMRIRLFRPLLIYIFQMSYLPFCKDAISLSASVSGNKHLKI